MVDTNLLLRRLAVIRHCVDRLKGRQHLSLKHFLEDPDAQDIVVHNLQIAVQAAVDAGAHIVTDQGWELPGSSVGTFEVLARHGVLPSELAQRLRKATQLRNLLVHVYDEIRFETIYSTYQNNLGDLEHFCESVAARF